MAGDQREVRGGRLRRRVVDEDLCEWSSSAGSWGWAWGKIGSGGVSADEAVGRGLEVGAA